MLKSCVRLSLPACHLHARRRPECDRTTRLLEQARAQLHEAARALHEASCDVYRAEFGLHHSEAPSTGLYVMASRLKGEVALLDELMAQRCEGKGTQGPSPGVG